MSADYAVCIIATVQNTVLVHVHMYIRMSESLYLCMHLCQYVTVVTIIILQL